MNEFEECVKQRFVDGFGGSDACSRVFSGQAAVNQFGFMITRHAEVPMSDDHTGWVQIASSALLVLSFSLSGFKLYFFPAITLLRRLVIGTGQGIE